MHDAGSVTMSVETIGSSVYSRMPLQRAVGRRLARGVDLFAVVASAERRR